MDTQKNMHKPGKYGTAKWPMLEEPAYYPRTPDSIRKAPAPSLAPEKRKGKKYAESRRSTQVICI